MITLSSYTNGCKVGRSPASFYSWRSATMGSKLHGASSREIACEQPSQQERDADAKQSEGIGCGELEQHPRHQPAGKQRAGNADSYARQRKQNRFLRTISP